MSRLSTPTSLISLKRFGSPNNIRLCRSTSPINASKRRYRRHCSVRLELRQQGLCSRAGKDSRRLLRFNDPVVEVIIVTSMSLTTSPRTVFLRIPRPWPPWPVGRRKSPRSFVGGAAQVGLDPGLHIPMLLWSSRVYRGCNDWRVFPACVEGSKLP